MIGLDTNVIVRYLTQDDPRQAKRATKIIEDGVDRGELFYIPSIVMCELVWVLEDAYRYSRREIQSVLGAILRTAQFRFEHKDRLWQALNDYRRGRADFPDFLLGRIAQEADCETTLTFDRSLKDSPLFEIL